MLSEPFWAFQAPMVFIHAAAHERRADMNLGIVDWMEETRNWARDLPIEKLENSYAKDCKIPAGRIDIVEFSMSILAQVAHCEFPNQGGQF